MAITETPTDMPANAAAVQKLLYGKKECKDQESTQPSATYLKHVYILALMS